MTEPSIDRTVAVAERAEAGFRAAYGDRPTGVWAAPGRVNLIGEHTDYNDGYVLPFALPQRTVVAAAPQPGAGWTVWSEQTGEQISFGADAVRDTDAAAPGTDGEAAPGTDAAAPDSDGQSAPGRLTGWGGYIAGVVWALHAAGFDVPEARLAIASDVPLGAGLSSSAALEAAVLTALVDLGDLKLPTEQRPRLAQRAENEYVGAPTGIMDQFASIRCQAGHALFLDCRTLDVEQIPFDLAGAGLALLVIDSRAPHRHVGGEYASRRTACERAAGLLDVTALRDVAADALPDALTRLPDDETRRRVRHVVTENQRVLDTVGELRAGRISGIGELLTASHRSMRDDFEITVPEVDTAVEAALAAGAYGARMTGGGFGGCVLALVDADAAERVGAAVATAYAERGFTAPRCFTAHPSPGATRLS